VISRLPSSENGRKEVWLESRARGLTIQRSDQP
jgi:hypothetical protein